MDHDGETGCLFWKVVMLGLALTGAPAFAADRPQTQTRPAIDQSLSVTLEGNTRPEATAANDDGAVADTLPLDHMMLQLRRAPGQEAALDRLIDALHDPASPHYHHWLDAAQVGAKYGPVVSDIAEIADWLGRHGFRVNFVYPDRMVIDFSGAAGQVRAAFQTQLHYLDVDGERHVANFGDPRIPAALAPAVVGIVTLNDFPSHSEDEFDPGGALTCKPSRLTGTREVVRPADLATIYDLNPLFGAGVTGTGQTIAVVETSNAANIADWTTFRAKYGLAAYRGGKVSVQHPQPPGGPLNCTNPNVGKAKDEAILDTEWSSAAAPNAHIITASRQRNTDLPVDGPAAIRRGATVSPRSCVFHDVTEGDNDAPCLAGSPDCFRPAGRYGVLSISTAEYELAFPTTPGWDFATGLGSVDAANLVEEWPTVAP